MDSGTSGAPHGDVGPTGPAEALPPTSTDRSPFATLVQSLPQQGGAAAETDIQQAVLNAVATEFLSIAEVAARVHLTIDEVTAVVAELAEQQRVRVFSSAESSVRAESQVSMSLLESVLNGISAL